MNILTFEGGFDKNLCYLVWCQSTKVAGIIDPSVEPDPIYHIINNEGLSLQKIILTHSHGDHTVYCDRIIHRFPSAIIHGFEHLESPVHDGKFLGVRHKSIIELGKIKLTALHTPGHYPDSICLWNEQEEHLFTGDTVFVGRTGRVIGEKSDLTQLYHSVYNIINRLPEDTIIHPGHHYGTKKTTTIGENIQTSTFFNCPNLREFSSVMDNFEKNRRG